MLVGLFHVGSSSGLIGCSSLAESRVRARRVSRLGPIAQRFVGRRYWCSVVPALDIKGAKAYPSTQPPVRYATVVGSLA